MASYFLYKENKPVYWKNEIGQKVLRFIQISGILYVDIALNLIGFDGDIDIDWKHIRTHEGSLLGNFREAVFGLNYELQKGTNFNGTLDVDYEILITA